MASYIYHYWCIDDIAIFSNSRPHPIFRVNDYIICKKVDATHAEDVGSVNTSWGGGGQILNILNKTHQKVLTVGRFSLFNEKSRIIDLNNIYSILKAAKVIWLVSTEYRLEKEDNFYIFLLCFYLLIDMLTIIYLPFCNELHRTL